jgi:hypothetical protein
MTERTSIKMICAALDEQGAEVVLRGVIDPASLVHLRVADYQREILPTRTINSLCAALQAGGVPDIQLGCRGGNYLERDGNFFIQDETYIIDGLQRRSAALKLLEKGILPHLGAVISFNTTEDKERERFRALNVSRVKLSPNVLLRNLRHNSVSAAALYQLCNSSQFAMYKRVSWQQSMRRDELITATTLVKATGQLHRYFGTQLEQRAHEIIMAGMDRLVNKIGRTTFMNNVREYWSTMNDVFHVTDVVYRDTATFIRSGFLTALSIVFGGHQDFWKDTEFFVPIELKRKLATFPLQDPNVKMLAGSAGNSNNLLAGLIVEHLNKGKSTKRLRPLVSKDYEQANKDEL